MGEDSISEAWEQPVEEKTHLCEEFYYTKGAEKSKGLCMNLKRKQKENKN